MPKITFIEPNGERTTIEASNGLSLMQAAKQNAVEGILAECGGSCACATCHVYIAETFQANMPTLGEYEDEMLADTQSPRLPTSRLSCQISISDDLDGLEVHIPEEQ